MYLKNLYLVILMLKVLLINGQDIYFKSLELYDGHACETNGGEPGICVPVSNCTRILGDTKDQNVCSFDHSTAIICYKRSNVTISHGPDGRYTTRDLEKAICVAEEVCYTEKQKHHGFAGGQKAQFGEHPHMSAIGWTEPDGSVSWDCGGSYIAKDFILTAAHCTWKQGVEPDIARTGDIDLLKTEKEHMIFDFNITEIYIHPKYKPSKFYYDIALLRVTPREEYYFLPKPICLWTEPTFPVTSFLAMGYGLTSFAGSKANQLLEGYLDLIDGSKCNESYEINNRLPFGIQDIQICALDFAGKSDTGQGDSGGPLQFFYNKRTYLAGITSFGQICAGATPGVYTKVSSFITWIADIVWL